MSRAQYYSPGYTPPAGVNSATAVKEYQKMLGVAADGIWGPNTQAAYDQYYGGGQSSSPTGGKWDAPAGSDLFNSYYQTILNQIGIPSMSVNTPSTQEIRDQWQSALRPSVDAAIARRQSAGRTAQAELDADAVSRGMGSSSYLSSVKSREGAKTQEDIGQMEAHYGATLAERIAASLQSYEQMRLSAEQYNLQAQQNARQAALNLAGDWYENYTAQQNALMQAAAKPAASKSAAPAKASSSLNTSDYLYYVDHLSESDRRQLFTSGQSYWKVRREELMDALGSGSYLSLRDRYLGK